MSDKIKALVVGLGAIGLKYDLEGPGDTVMTHTQSCLSHPGVTLAGGVDLDVNARQLFEKSVSLPAFNSVPEAVQSLGTVDLVIISTPSAVRRTVIEEALCAKPRVLLVEKPIATTVQEGRDIVDLCRARGVSLAVNYFRRFDPALQALGRSIQSGALGAVKQATCVYTGDILTSASHYVDLLLSWFGSPMSAGRLDRCRPLGFSMSYDGFDVVFRQLESGYGLGEMEVFLENGRVVLSDYCEVVKVWESLPDPVFPSYRKLAPVNHPFGLPDFLRYQYNVMNAVVEHMNRGATLVSTGETALASLKVCFDAGH